MEQSLIAAVSGIDASQTYLDVIGNNIANANTTAYKSQNVGFTDLLTEQIAGASAPTGSSGGINPEAIGAGVAVGTVSENMTPGAVQQTNVPSDVAIQGNGFLMAKLAGQTFYTRDGQLQVDANGNLTAPNGALIQGWEASAAGSINSNAPTTTVTIPTTASVPATATTNITLGGNLQAGATSPVTFTYDAYDSLGNVVPVTFTLTPPSSSSGSANTWTMQATVPGTGGTTVDLFNPSSLPTLSFNSSGKLTGVTGVTTSTGPNGQIVVDVPAATAGSGSTTGYGWPPSGTSYQFASGSSLTLTLPTSSGGVTQQSISSDLQGTSQNGNAAGTLESYAIGADGVVTGSFSNGQSQTIAQIALATFANPSGLSDLGNLMYQATSNSGQAVVNQPGSGLAGTLLGGALEASNVDLSTQLTDLIVAQESYQANTKVISTTDMAMQSLMQVP